MTSPSAISDEEKLIQSRLISRDLSWLQFNYRVLDQAKKSKRTVLEKLKFLAITASNLDEFLMIRVGSLYNYLDYGKKRIDYSGLREKSFKKKLFNDLHTFVDDQYTYFNKTVKNESSKAGFAIVEYKDLNDSEVRKAKNYFSKTVYPMLTPMVYDTLHSFPILMNKVLIFAVCTSEKNAKKDDDDKTSFIQIPQNLPRFFEIERDNHTLFLPIEEIIKANTEKLFQNVKINDIALFRIMRNGDFDWDDYEEYEESFIEEVQKKLKSRKTGRVVRLEIQPNFPKKFSKLLKKKYDLDSDNIFELQGLFDLTSLWQIVGNSNLNDFLPKMKKPVLPLGVNTSELEKKGILNYLKDEDIFLHHPYNSFDYVTRLVEDASEDSGVLSIKITIYRLAKNSRIAAALLKAAENGKHVSVLFEVKARFDEENNLKAGQKLQKAGCFVMYGVPEVKTHTKLLFIVRQEGKKVTRYVHMSSGNYNESTAKLYSDTSYLTTTAAYGRDVSEFFNAVTGHSKPTRYEKLITTPGDMRKSLIRLINIEANNARKGLKSGIIIKVNSFQDDQLIEALYTASHAGVKIKLIVRGICCIRPGRDQLSENIEVKSIVGDYLEHSRIYYFHNNGNPKIYGGSADVMVRSFDRRIESLFLIEGKAMEMAKLILDYNIRDISNSYIMDEFGEFSRAQTNRSQIPFNIFEAFFAVKENELDKVELF